MKFLNLSFLLRNFWYKVSSLLLALLIWGIVQGEEVMEINTRIKVNFSVANGFMVKDKPYRNVDAKLRGPRVLMGELANRPIEAKIYIPSDQVGNLEIPFDKKYIKDWDDRISITLKNSYISVFVDEKLSRQVAVREVLQGAPAEGSIIEKVQIKPEKVTITGLKSEIVKLDEVVTEPIDITGLQQSKTVEAGIILKGFDQKSVSDNIVKVSLQVGQSKINKRYSYIPLEVVGSEYASKVSSKTVSIVIQGTPTVISGVTKKQLNAFIEAASLVPGKYEKEVKVKIPADTVLIETIPQKVTLTIETQKRQN